MLLACLTEKQYTISYDALRHKHDSNVYGGARRLDACSTIRYSLAHAAATSNNRNTAAARAGPRERMPYGRRICLRRLPQSPPRHLQFLPLLLLLLTRRFMPALLRASAHLLRAA